MEDTESANSMHTKSRVDVSKKKKNSKISGGDFLVSSNSFNSKI